MKANISFNLPDEHTEFMAAVNSMDMYRHLTDLRDHLRSHIRHSAPLHTPEDLRAGIEEILALINS